MSRADVLTSFQICDRATDFKNSIISAGRQSQSCHGSLEHLLAVRIDAAMAANHARRHRGVRKYLFAGKALTLAMPGADYSIPNCRRVFRLRRSISRELSKLYGRNIDVNIDAVQQRTRDPADITLNQQRCTTALSSWVIPKSTRTGIHRRRQHERCRKRQRHGSSAYRHLLIFEWLSQHLQYAAIKLR